MVTDATAGVAQTVSPDALVTWTSLALERVLAERVPEFGRPCFSPPAMASSYGGQPSRLFLALVGGTAVVDGVRITQTSIEADLRLQPGQRYLLVGQRCPGNVFELRDGPTGVWLVSPKGEIGPSLNAIGGPLEEFMHSFGTVDGLETYLKTAR